MSLLFLGEGGGKKRRGSVGKGDGAVVDVVDRRAVDPLTCFCFSLKLFDLQA